MAAFPPAQGGTANEHRDPRPFLERGPNPVGAATTLFRLAQIGLDHSEEALCDTVLALAGGIELAQWQRSDDTASADLIIVSAERRTALAALGDDPGPLVAIVGEDDGETTSEVLRTPRPLSYAALLELLREAESRLGAETHSFDDWTERFLHPPPPATETTASTAATSVDAAGPPNATPTSEENHHDTNGTTGKQDGPANPSATPPTTTGPAPDGADAPLPTLEIAIDDVEILESLLARTTVDEPLTEIRLKAPAPVPPATAEGDAVEAGTTGDSPPTAATNAGRANGDRPLAKVIPLPLVKEIGTTTEPAGPSGEAALPQPARPGERDLFRPARRFIPKLRLLGLLQEIVADGGNYIVSHAHHPDILVWARPGVFRCDQDLRQSVALFRRPWSEFKLTALKQQPLPSPDSPPSLPLHLLSYLAALHGGEGRLMLGVDAEAVLKLRSLPDFELLGGTPAQRRLATHLLDHPATLGELATATQTAIPAVIDFTNACREIGLIEEIRRKTETTHATPDGLFHRLRKRWGRRRWDGGHR